MGTLPKPLVGVLVVAIAFFAVWTVALKPSSSDSSSTASSPSPTIAKAAIDKAHAAAAATAKSSAADGAPVQGAATATTAAKPAPAAAAKPTAPAVKPHVAAAASAAKPSPAKAPTVNAVMQAINRHEAVALLFYNPAGADDQAVAQELKATAPAHGQVAKFAVPISQVSAYNSVTTKLAVQVAPTLVIVDRQGRASTLVGFADSLEISQRISDALSAK